MCRQVGEVFYVKGALERILKLCRSYDYFGSVAPLSPKQQQVYFDRASLMGTSGLRGNVLLLELLISIRTDNLYHLMVPPRFQPRSEAYDGTTSPHGYHTEKKTHAVWPPGQNGRDS